VYLCKIHTFIYHFYGSIWYNIYESKQFWFFTESDEFTMEDPKLTQYDDRIKPHEQRVLNFLVNEYLMQHNYKLTSITFADENENQVNYFDILFKYIFIIYRYIIFIYILLYSMIGFNF